MRPLLRIFLIFLFLATFHSCIRQHADPSLRYGAVAAASPKATQAGMDILQQGGNAVDAAIAISFVLGVTEPAMSGIGGGTQVILYLPGKDKPFSIDGFYPFANSDPYRCSERQFESLPKNHDPFYCKNDGILYSYYASGNLSWASLLQPAIKYAQEGFVMGPFRERIFD